MLKEEDPENLEGWKIEPGSVNLFFCVAIASYVAIPAINFFIVFMHACI